MSWGHVGGERCTTFYIHSRVASPTRNIPEGTSGNELFVVYDQAKDAPIRPAAPPLF